MSSLYDLPKEMLIKIICDIEEEWREKDERSQKSLQLYKTLFGGETEELQCSFESCKNCCMIKEESDHTNKCIAVTNSEYL